ncbi:MAG: hypothetical protein RLZZ127_1390 [Planctomycetota bacterium]
MTIDNTPNGIDLDAMHDAIVAKIRERFPAFNEVGDYSRISKSANPPSCYVQLTDATPAADPGTDQLRLTLRWEALLVFSFRAEKAKRSVRVAAVELALFIKDQRWGLECGPATIEQIQQDGFSPELDQYECWRVDWTQEVNVGPNVWVGEAVPDPMDVTIREDVVPDGYAGL